MTTASISVGGAGVAGRVPSSVVRGRWAWTAVGLALAVAAIAIWTGQIVVAQFADSFATIPAVQRTFRVPVRAVNVSVGFGTVVIERGPSTAAVVETSGTRAAQAPTDHETLVGRTLDIRSTCGGPPANGNYCRRDYVLRVPANAKVTAAVGTGNLQISGVAGPVQASMATGAIVLSRTTGPVRATVDTGSITAVDARGSLSLRTANGNVTVSGATGTVSMASGTGNLTATDLTSRTVSATTANGSINLAFQSSPEHVSAASQTGDVTVILPPGGPAYRLELSSGTGTVSSSMSSNPTSSRVVRATTANGNIGVSADGHPYPVGPSRPVLPVPSVDQPG